MSDSFKTQFQSTPCNRELNDSWALCVKFLLNMTFSSSSMTTSLHIWNIGKWSVISLIIMPLMQDIFKAMLLVNILSISETNYLMIITETTIMVPCHPWQWRHNGRHGVSNHQPHACLLNRLFKAQIKENIKALRHWPFVQEIHRGPVNSPHKGPVTRKMSPFDDVIIL